MNKVSNKVKATFKQENLPFIEYGLNKEQEQEELIKERYGNKLKRTKHYATFDWISDEFKIELKNRTCNYDTFSTTIIGLNKIKAGIKDTRDCYFLFGFADGSLWEWKLDKSKTYVGETRNEFVGNGNYTPFNPNKLNYYLPLKECIQILPPKKTGCLIQIK
jgi:hypothetical protein